MPRLAAALLLLFATTPTFAATQPTAADGLALARQHCAACHAIGRTDRSALFEAPALRDLHARYPVEALEEALAEGILTGHPGMPQFQFTSGEIAGFIAYLKSLERPPAPGR